jgi:hypothetical protein
MSRRGEPDMQSSRSVAKRPQTSESESPGQFKLVPIDDIDFVLGHTLGVRVGTQNRSPEELKKRIATALFSYWTGTKSMDYMYKRYLNSEEFREDRSLGGQISTYLEDTIERREKNSLSSLIEK